MRLAKRDLMATGLLTIGVALYLLWLATSTIPGLSNTRVTGGIILGLGFAASAVAVVPGFDQLVHGDKSYLAVTSLLGLIAFAAGLQMILFGSGVGLTVMMAVMVALWAIATVHHLRLARADQPGQAGRGAERQALAARR